MECTTHYNGCDCAEIKKLKAALDWYAEQAMKLNAYVLEMDQNRMIQVVSELALDNGRRARIEK